MCVSVCGGIDVGVLIRGKALISMLLHVCERVWGLM